MANKKQLPSFEEIKDKPYLTMEETQVYLNHFGFDVLSRKSFYKFMDYWKLDFVELNPGGKKSWRRFKREELQKFVQDPVAYRKERLRKLKEQTHEEQHEEQEV